MSESNYRSVKGCGCIIAIVMILTFIGFIIGVGFLATCLRYAGWPWDELGRFCGLTICLFVPAIAGLWGMLVYLTKISIFVYIGKSIAKFINSGDKDV